MRFKAQLFLTGLILYSSLSSAEICDTIFRTSSIGCQDLATSHSSAGSYPLLFDALNFSPSALPTIPTPVGIEAYYNEKKVNVAFIKGIEKVGFGAGIKHTDTTFFSGVENYKVALKQSVVSYRPSALEKTFNLGSALNLLEIPEFASLPIGLSLRINPETKSYSLQPGIDVRTEWLTLSGSFYKDKPKTYNDGILDISENHKITNIMASLRFDYLLVDYSFLKQDNSADLFYNGSRVVGIETGYVTKTHILSGTFVYEQLSLTGAYRKQSDSRLSGNYNIGNPDYKTTHSLFGAAYKTPFLELGIFYNYVLNEDVSALLKIFIE